MNYFQIAYTALGGLGIFFLGMKFLSEGLQTIAGDFARRLINAATSNRLMAVFIGLAVTVLVQSSSISTVMVVGLANAGLMQLTQAIGVILGANIGTTITGWILAIKVGKYGLLFIGVGIFPMLFAKRGRFQGTGKALVALGLIFFGLELMSGAFKPLRSDPGFLSMLHYFEAYSLPSIIGCVVVGCVLTFVIQSSSAMLGITIALALTGTISFRTAAALVLGENIGTTITAQLAAIGGTVTARRAAISHAIFNVIGVILVVSFFEPFIALVDSLLPGDPDLLSADGSKPNIAAHIALGHSLFNVTAVVVMIPFIQYLARLVEWLVPERDKKIAHRLRYISAPGSVSVGVDLGIARRELEQMMRIVAKMLTRTKVYLCEKQDSELFQRLQNLEEETDEIQAELTRYVCNVLQEDMSDEDSVTAYSIIRTTDELESIADYALSLCHYRNRMDQKGERFSDQAWSDVKAYAHEVFEYFKETRDFLSAQKREERINAVYSSAAKLNDRANEIRTRHLDRMRSGLCKPLPALAFSDIIVSLRRIKNHILNLAEAAAPSPQDKQRAVG